jgi:agmatine deiminase
MILYYIISAVCAFGFGHSPASTQTIMPPEWQKHEGTWLQWPHDKTYGAGTRDYFESAWIEMTRQLIKGEKVHIIAYDTIEQMHIAEVLASAAIAPDSIDFFIHPNNDYWVRDNGPIFVYNTDGMVQITDWGFDGWGNDAPFALCNEIPNLIGSDIGATVLDINSVVLEGGAVEHDGNGTFFATESSILGDGRNPGMTTADIETYLNTYLGFERFIWLEGKLGGGFDITDAHIDGFLKFHDSLTIVTMNEADLNYWFVNASDRNIIANATNKDGLPYNYVYLPLTDKNVKTEDGVNTGSKGSYVNYYVANAVALVPIYNDDNDSIALSILQTLMPDKEVVGIDCRNMFSWGGMVHCVTQQQPFGSWTGAVAVPPSRSASLFCYPQPFTTTFTIQCPEIIHTISIYDMAGRQLFTQQVGATSVTISPALSKGAYLMEATVESGIYTRICVRN